MNKRLAFLSLTIPILLLLAACGAKDAVIPAPADEPSQVTGTMDYTNEYISALFDEHMVALVDMYGFVIRDDEWEIPIGSQVLGYMNMDESSLHAEYTLLLPQLPTGQFVDVDQDGAEETGVQVFAVSYWPNVYAGPYSEGDDRSRGWAAGFSSNKTDPEREDEVNGGKLLVWAPDGDQAFPSGYGTDGMLFTADDPVSPIPAGWTVVDLDQEPFAFIKEAVPALMLYEPSDYAVKDYSEDSYTEAFDKLIEFLRMNYAFNGIEGKQPDYDALVNELRPRVEAAQAAGDAEAFYLALRDLTYAFKDGHVGLSGGEIQNRLFGAETAGGYGFAIRQLEDGRFVVIHVNETGPAHDAGILVGAEVTGFKGMPIADAVAAVKPWSLPASTEWQVRYQQVRYLLRTVPGTEASLTFTNPAAQPQTVTLQAVAERDSFNRTSIYFGAPTNLLPVEFKLLESGVGYVAVYSEADDIQLTIKLFERALQTFQSAAVPGIIIDMRYNGGGTPLGLAGFLTDQEIPLGQSYYFNENSGKFEPEGSLDKIIANGNQYRFDKIVVLVGPACASACEEESYGFSQVPGAEVVGMFPTASMFGEVSRGQFVLPEGFAAQFPTGRYLLPEGSLFLEGTGVQPSLQVPITLETVVTTEDVILQFGERAVLQPLGAGITPSAAPTLLSQEATQAALSTARQLEEKARESYETDDFLAVPNDLTYTIALSKSETLLWVWGWCAADQATLDDNLGRLAVSFSMNSNVVPLERFLKVDYDASDGQRCSAYILGLEDWAGGEHHLVTKVDFTSALNDGVFDFPAGVQTFRYNIYMKP